MCHESAVGYWVVEVLCRTYDRFRCVIDITDL